MSTAPERLWVDVECDDYCSANIGYAEEPWKGCPKCGAKGTEYIRAVEIARRHMREAESARDASLAFGDTRAALVQARQAQIADAIAREIEGIANDR